MTKQTLLRLLPDAIDVEQLTPGEFWLFFNDCVIWVRAEEEKWEIRGMGGAVWPLRLPFDVQRDGRTLCCRTRFLATGVRRLGLALRATKSAHVVRSVGPEKVLEF